MNWPIFYINRKYEELSYPQKSDNVRHHSSNQCDPIIVNPVVKMQPQFSGISPLASYKEVHPPGVSHDEAKDLCQQELTWRYMYSQPGQNFISIKRGKDFLGHGFREWKIIFEKILKRFYLIIGKSKFQEIMITDDTLNEKSKDYTAKLIQNNVYCFFITILRLAILAFFSFKDVTELM